MGSMNSSTSFVVQCDEKELSRIKTEEVTMYITINTLELDELLHNDTIIFRNNNTEQKVRIINIMKYKSTRRELVKISSNLNHNDYLKKNAFFDVHDIFNEFCEVICIYIKKS